MRYSLLSVALLLAASSASPLLGVDQPISERAIVDQPISALGLDKRETLDARDERKNCGKSLSGDKAGGDGIWCPVDQYLEKVDEFCEVYTGTQVSYRGVRQQSYGITLTNQDDASKTGSAGHILFVIYNRELDPAYMINKDDCVSYMSKQSNEDSKCYGKKHKDTKGGYWNVDGVGLFGSEIYEGGI
ncbi:hypothetical protein MMC29_004170 [Sticta canariensis]|nr:hypothetical protein [Sticta canariensis]